MRLTCPNCGAEYEVPDEVIPTSGRDVQCSNCGDTWYQYHPDYMPEGDDIAYDDAALSDPAPDMDPAPDLPPAPSDDPVDAEDDADFDFAPAISDDSGDDGSADPDEDEFYEDDDEEDAGPPPASAALRRRTLDPEVQSILREEAQYEERARDQEMLESQPDLGLTEPVQTRREDKADDRLARMRNDPGEDDRPKTDQSSVAAASAAVAASRRDLLPDIEEINSTLRRKGDSMRGGPRTRRGSATEQETRSGTRRGFITVLVILALGAILYLQAPNIGNAVPQLKGPMTTYVDTIDRARAWLDIQASSLVEKLDNMSGEEPGEAPQDPAPTE